MHPFILSLLERFEISFPVNANAHKLGTISPLLPHHHQATTFTTSMLTSLCAISSGDYASVLRPAAEGEDLYLIPSMLPEVRPSQLQFLWPATKGTPQQSKRANWDGSNVWMVRQVATNRFSGGVTAWRLCPRVSSDGS
jgi:hypothetical protein